MIKKPLIIHPFLFAVFPVLFLYSHNVEQLPFSVTLLPLVITVCATSFLLFLLTLILKNGAKAGIIVSIFLILFFSHNHIYEVVQSWQIGRWDRHKDLLRAWAILFSFATYFVIRSRKKLTGFTNVLNVIALFLVVTSLVKVAIYEFNAGDIWQGYGVSGRGVPSSVAEMERRPKHRDIYYIILDGYANASTLRELCDYDNSEFRDYLTNKGFYVASKSCCNYPCTYLSLPSCLNMQYVNYLQGQMGRVSRDVAVLIEMIRDNKVVRFLKARGYKYIHFTSSWEPTKDNDYADLNIGRDRSLASRISMSEFVTLLIKTTILGGFSFTKDAIEGGRKEQLLSTLSQLAEVPRIKGPKYVFSHIMLPHPPYIFDRNGERVTQTESTARNWKPEWQYLDQLIFTNGRIKVLVDKILSRSKIPPIIILQADHGPAFHGNHFSKEVIQERMRIFNAYYLPDFNKELLYDSITPVNTFRLVLKYYFDEDYEFLEDKVYFTDTDESFYDFIDITDEVKFQ